MIQSSKSFLFPLAASLTFLLAAEAAAQAHLLADLRPGTSASLLGAGAITVLGERAIFSASDGSASYLYTSDGTAAGTTPYYTLSTTAPFSHVGEMVALGGRLFFPFGVGTGSELWVTDGTAAGTGLVIDIRPGSSGSSPGGLAAIGGVLYFSAADIGGNYELWRSDGTATGTWLVKEINPSATVGSTPTGFTELGSTGRFLFSATDATTGRELWVSDGTAAGTMLLADLVPGGGTPGSSTPLFLTRFGDRVAFGCLGGLWLSDGTAAGTVAVTTSGGASHIAEQNGKLWFKASDPVHGVELWASDGTAAGTAMVADINSPSGSYPAQMTPVGSRWIWFSATTTASGEELWRTDGTTTELFTEVAGGSTSGGPRANGYPGTVLMNSRFAVTVSGKVFFFANDVVHGFEPWVFDTGVVAEVLGYGSSCGALSLTAGTPWLAATVTLTTSGIPAAAVLSANALSFTEYAPPLDLASFGMPGCFQHCGLDAVVLLFGTGTVARTLSIPGHSSWLGARLHSQSYSLVPGINALGAISSNGVTLRLGDL